MDKTMEDTSGSAPDATMADPSPAVVAVAAAAAAPKRPAADDASEPSAKKATTQLQQQIQEQLQHQLQAQLQAAAARGQQPNIRPEQIQAQAQAMVQAAAQAQAVVNAAKSRGGGLVPMNAGQIQALSQIQAQAIVNARKSQGTPQQIQTQIQLQAQALVHAHTQAQIQSGIYKGDKEDKEAKKEPKKQAVVPSPSLTTAVTSVTTVTPPVASDMHLSNAMASAMDTGDGVGGPQPSSTSPQFLAMLDASLAQFWIKASDDISKLQNQTEQDFKNHNDLPLARIKRIMKSDEDVRMISAEAPVLFAKACELFILDLSIRSWNYSQLHKRRTLQKEDVREAIQKTDIFDFLVDVIQ